MRFSVITPSFRQLDWLTLCAASIADQGVEHEHLVQDAGSPGIEAWMAQHPQVQVRVEKDEGMYDAVNRGFARASGEILSYLNCDEQYLPGTLQKVGDYFQQHPEIDVLFGDAVLANASHEPVAYRRVISPLAWHTLLRPLGVLTCSTFFRRKLVEDGVLFDTSWKIVGDKPWVYEIVKRGCQIGTLPEPLSVFVLTGENLSQDPRRLREKDRWLGGLSPGFRLLTPLVQAHHVWRKWCAGAYHSHRGDLRYYRSADPTQRATFADRTLGPSWPKSTPTSSSLL